jgi:uncharacterized protein YbjT (DUF2867 family)
VTTDLVTGAFGYTGSFVAERLLSAGREVRTLTRRPAAGHPLASRIGAVPLRFDEGSLAAAFEGVDTLYNTYWRRFPGPDGFADIVAQSGQLLRAASAAGVRRIVHFSVSGASDDAPTSYFRAKAEVERLVQGSGLSYAIVRPTLLYGPGDILLNNLAWTLRRVPVFGVPGRGDYLVQPVLVSDLADLAIRLAGSAENLTITAAGPETFRFVDLVRLIRDEIGVAARIIHVSPTLALLGARVIGRLVSDRVLTRDEIVELMAGLLVAPGDPTCPTKLSEWLVTQAASTGREYTSELERNYRGT